MTGVPGLGPDTDLGQLKGRYRDAAKRHHPDRGGDAPEFNRIEQAYDKACDLLSRRTPARSGVTEELARKPRPSGRGGIA